MFVYLYGRFACMYMYMYSDVCACAHAPNESDAIVPLPLYPAAFADVTDAAGGVERQVSARQVSTLLEQDWLHVEWVTEVPEDLDVFIAQREFEAAVDLVEKGERQVGATRRGRWARVVGTLRGVCGRYEARA